MMPFQDLTNANLASRFYQRAHDNEAGPSTTYVSRVPSTGGFHPNQGSRPHYLQLYIYDTDHELQNRMRENPILNQAVVYKLQKILHQCNSFVIVFSQLALEPNIEECRLLIKEHPSNQPRYSLPSASQVATIVIGGGDEDTIERGRDINVINCDGKLTKVQETMGYYDPVQYPILLPFGTYGWDIETKTNVGTNVTCREYYSYVLQLKDDVINKGVLGRVKIYMYVTEFQKCGLPHVHMILILDTDDKLREPEEYDSVVKAEIPRHESEPKLIGDGNEPAKEDDMVRMPAEIVIPWEGEISIKNLIQHKFPQLENHGWDASYMVERAILNPKNCDVHMLNDMIINKFPGDEHILLSFDEVKGDTHNLYQQEYLHIVAPGHNAGKRAFLPRIKLKTTDGAGLPFVLIRKQFPVKLSFAITINKSQRQTIPNVRIYLPRHVFSYGQLYVALSKVKREIFMISIPWLTFLLNNNVT
ncbi:hypothetical protein KIW84_031659 [Lathyrus oleraceus]|uniref:Helitron helicase-like domain-containing protein n=1 Tax=Pisum sativum TaxID=3888 RepID=A0A9D4XSZ2_PEA|nr:hypothetical protein KIW84_031659 [Pisum sativum]